MAAVLELISKVMFVYYNQLDYLCKLCVIKYFELTNVLYLLRTCSTEKIMEFMST